MNGPRTFELVSPAGVVAETATITGPCDAWTLRDYFFPHPEQADAARREGWIIREAKPELAVEE